MMFIKVETINEGILRSAIRFACEKQGVSPDECYEVIGRKILNGDFTAICGSWYDAFAAYYHGAAAFFGPTSGFQERDKRILDLEKQLAALRTNAPSFTDNTKPTKPLASAGAGELVEALDLALPEAKCVSCNEGPEKHRITVSVKWCNHSEVIAEYFPSLTGPKKPTKPLLGDRARDLLLRGAQTIEGLLGANPESTPERSYAYGLAGAMREHGANS